MNKMNQKSSNINSKVHIWLPLLLGTCLAVGMLIGARLSNPVSAGLVEKYDSQEIVYGRSKIEEIIRYIEAKYVDEVKREALVEEAINGILDELDPHSTYIPADQYHNVNDPLEGNFKGIGVEFMIMDDTIVIVNSIKGGPSEEAGIRTGDKIIAVEDSIVAGIGISTEGIKNLLKGEEGSKVKIGIKRFGEQGLKYFDIERDKIPMASLDAAYMLDPSTAYVKINRFSATANREFVDAIDKMIDQQRLDNLILDLRQNPGGYLRQATEILSQIFSEKGNLLVYTKGEQSSREDHETTGNAYFDIGKVVVLIDEGSASASEIVAGAIQDYDRGHIIGRRSYGKGLVQKQFRLSDGSALRLTIAKYYTPSGRSIQKPYKNQDFSEYENELMERYHSGELLLEQEMTIEDTTNYYTRNGRVVFGGGGIIPDIFVPLDTVMYRDEFINLRQEVAPFIFHYYEKLLSEEKERFATFDQFKDAFDVDANSWNAFMAHARSRGFDYSNSQMSELEPYLKRAIKAEMAKLLFDSTAYFKIWNKDDKIFQKAIDVLNDPNSLTVLRE